MAAYQAGIGTPEIRTVERAASKSRLNPANANASRVVRSPPSTFSARSRAQAAGRPPLAPSHPELQPAGAAQSGSGWPEASRSGSFVSAPPR